MDYLIEYLIKTYKKPNNWKKTEERVKVGEFSAKLATAYEKFRNIFEYNEEHLVRRQAIYRILKRIFLNNKNPKKISRQLIEELIRAKYLPNDKLPVEIIDIISAVVSKYLYIQNKIGVSLNQKNKNKTLDWLLNIAVVEIEDALIPHHREDALLEVMYKTVKDNVVFKVNQQKKDIFVFVASARSLFRVDNSWISYKLLCVIYKDWKKHNKKQIDDFVNNFWTVKNNISSIINNKLVDKLSKNLKTFSVYFLIIDGILRKYISKADEIFSDKEKLNDIIRKECSIRYKHGKEVLRRSAIRSVLFIFFTKIVLAFIIEVPFDMFYHGEILFIPLFTNILFHPFLLLFISSATKIPSYNNTKKIIQGINWLVFGIEDDKNNKIFFNELKFTPSSTTRGIIATVFYFAMYLVTFGLLVFVLDKLGFNFVSMGLFLLFLSLVSFFAIRIRQSARSLVVEDKKENFFTALFDLFTLPIVRAGRWISLKSSKINVFVFVLDFIIEAPFKKLVELFDDLFDFIKEKKEEIY